MSSLGVNMQVTILITTQLVRHRQQIGCPPTRIRSMLFVDDFNHH